MANFVTIRSEFEVYKAMLLERFTNADFEDNPFNNMYKYYLCFEFDFIFHESFFDGLKKFISKVGDNSVVFYTIDPSPENYYFNHFSKYSVFEISSLASAHELNIILSEDPGDSPADDLSTNTNVISWFSKSNEWAILGSREWEIAIVGFTNKKTQRQFIDSFSNNAQTMFTTVREQVQGLDRMLSFSKETMEVYEVLVKNYKERSNEL